MATPITPDAMFANTMNYLTQDATGRNLPVLSQFPFLQHLMLKKAVMEAGKQEVGVNVYSQDMTAVEVSEFTEQIPTEDIDEPVAAEWHIKGAKLPLKIPAQFQHQLRKSSEAINTYIRTTTPKGRVTGARAAQIKLKRQNFVNAQYRICVQKLAFGKLQHAVIAKIHEMIMGSTTYAGSIRAIFDQTTPFAPSSSYGQGSNIDLTALGYDEIPYHIIASGGTGAVPARYSGLTLTGRATMSIAAFKYAIMQMIAAGSSRGKRPKLILMPPTDINLIMEHASGVVTYRDSYKDTTAYIVTEVPDEVKVEKYKIDIGVHVPFIINGLPCLPDPHLPSGHAYLVDDDIVSIDFFPIEWAMEFMPEIDGATGTSLKMADVDFAKSLPGDFMYLIGSTVKTGSGGIGMGSIFECGTFMSFNPNNPAAVGLIVWAPTSLLS